MSEIFDIITAVNRLKTQVETLNTRIDTICKFPALIAYKKNIDEKTAAKLLDVSVRELQRMRKKNEITYTLHHRKVTYPISGINRYLKSKTFIN